MLSFLLMLCVGPILDFCHFCILPILPNILALTELFFKFHIFAPLSNQQPCNQALLTISALFQDCHVFLGSLTKVSGIEPKIRGYSV